MSQCLRITFLAQSCDVVRSFIYKHAKQCDLEGTVQQQGDKIRVVACGSRVGVEQFLDFLHKGIVQKQLEQIEVEPFLKDKDYRGVFRIIE